MLNDPYLLAFITTLFVGLLCELTARLGKLWIYRKPIYPVLNILLMFGIVMGALSLLIPRTGSLPVNFSHLHWWDFPGDKFLFFSGQEACARSVAILWGITPLLSNAIQSYLS